MAKRKCSQTSRFSIFIRRSQIHDQSFRKSCIKTPRRSPETYQWLPMPWPNAWQRFECNRVWDGLAYHPLLPCAMKIYKDWWATRRPQDTGDSHHVSSISRTISSFTSSNERLERKPLVSPCFTSILCMPGRPTKRATDICWYCTCSISQFSNILKNKQNLKTIWNILRTAWNRELFHLKVTNVDDSLIRYWLYGRPGFGLGLNHQMFSGKKLHGC